MAIDGYEKTIGREMVQVAVGAGRLSPLVYLTDDFKLDSFGTMMVSGRFARLFIGVFDGQGGWDGGGGTSLFAPAQTYAEAVAVWAALAEDSPWLAAASLDI